MKNIAKALLDAQKKIKNAKIDAANPHFKSDYATLESVISSVKDIANASGIAIVQTSSKDDQGHFLETLLIHADSGEQVTSKVYLVLDKQNMQGLGSALTYARRYSLASLFCIGTEDDDANEAAKQAPKPQNKPLPQKPSGFGIKPVTKKPVENGNGYPSNWDSFDQTK